MTIESIHLNNMTTTTPATSSSNFLTHENLAYGIKVQYPSNWLEKVDNYSSIDPYVVVATFFSPLESSSDRYQECVQIVIDNSSTLASDLEQYMLENIILTRKSYTDFRLLSSNSINVRLADNPAYVTLYEYSDPKFGIIKVEETGTLVQGKGYYIQYFAEPEKYPIYLPTIQTMFDSFALVAPVKDDAE